MIPTWTSFYPTVGNSSYGVDTPSADIINWSQSASINDGLVTTNLTWSPTGNASLNLSYTIYAHRTRPNLGVVRLDMSGLQQGVEVSVTDVLDVRFASRRSVRFGRR